MLSRTAEAFFWIGRYVERAEYAARTISVQHQIMLEHGAAHYQAEAWAGMLGASGDLPLYRERRGAVEPGAALEFMALEAANPNSLLPCIKAARDNARQVQDQLSSEVWHHLNGFYLELKGVAPEDFRTRTHEVLNAVVFAGYTLQGVISSTMLHDERLAFCRLGRELERAGRTVRLLATPPRPHDPAEPPDLAEFEWSIAVLRSASAHEAYRKTYRSALDPGRIVELLLLSEALPRSVRSCARTLSKLMPLVDGSAGKPSAPGRLAGQLAAELDYATLEDVFVAGLPDYLGGLGDRLSALNDAIDHTYFRYAEAPFMPHALPQRRRPYPNPKQPTSTIQALLEVKQDFRYTYAGPVSNVRTVLRLVPNQRYGRQRLLDVRWTIEPPGELSQHVDAFGNQVWEVAHAHIEREISGTVELQVLNQAVYHAEGALALRGAAPGEDEPGGAFDRLDGLVDHSRELEAVAVDLASRHPQPAQRAEAIMGAVHAHMAFEAGVTGVDTLASEAFEAGRGVCQDYTHVMLSLCRQAGLSARYVSGYLPAEGVMHAWAEVLLDHPETGQRAWVAYDPTHGRRVDETYVTVATGRDYRDVTPMSGTYTGVGANRLEVKVKTRLQSRAPASRGTGTLTVPAVTPGAGQAAQQQQQQ